MWGKSDKKIQLKLLLEIAQKQTNDNPAAIDIDLNSPRRKENLRHLSWEGCIDYQYCGLPEPQVVGLTPKGERMIGDLQDNFRQDWRESCTLKVACWTLLIALATFLLTVAAYVFDFIRNFLLDNFVFCPVYHMPHCIITRILIKNHILPDVLL